MLEEKMLNAWVNVSNNIKENRLLNHFTFNEMTIFNQVYTYKEISFKQLCINTSMLKSQVNRTISSLIKKGYLIMKTSNEDKRSKVICFAANNQEMYLKEHQALIELMSKIKKKLGNKDAEKLVYLLNEISSIVRSEKND